MKALSVKQPWAWLIVNGYKDIENRKWKTNFRGRFLVHASLQIDLESYHQLQEIIELPAINSLEKGGIVGEARITDCLEISQSPWFQGPYGFVLDESRPLKFYPLRGRLRFFDVDFAP